MTTDNVRRAPPAEVEREPTRDERAEQIRKVLSSLEQRFDRQGNPLGPLRCMANLDTIVKDDPWFCRKIRLNGLSEAVEWEGRRMRDEDITRIQLAIYRTYRVEFTAQAVHAVVSETARQRTWHPVVRYLRRLRWDGEERIDRYLSSYLGAEDTPLHRAIARKWFVSCVARAMGKGEKPVKVDTVLTLVGPQGASKSTSFRVLASDAFFSDTSLDLRNKDAYQSIRGVWLYELAELASTRARDVETVKAFLSAPTDRYRPPYGRTVVESHRQVIFVGSTNEATPLRDPSGARRFWPVSVGKVDIDRIREDRDQLWAEAVAAWKAGETWWLSPEQDEELRDAQEKFQHEDPWEGFIKEWLAAQGGKGIRLGDILDGPLNMDPDKQGKHHEMRIGGILQRLGFERRRTRINGKREWRWFR
jgi:putative DNA primase/helicase